MDFTSKGLKKPGVGDSQLITDLNENADRLDSYGMGPFVCTSLTRPVGSNRWDGMLIWETDNKALVTYDASVGEWQYVKFTTAAINTWKLGADQNPANGAFTVLDADTLVDAADSVISASITSDGGGGFTVNKTGYYKINSQVIWGPQTQINRVMNIITKNCPSIAGTGILASGEVLAAENVVNAGVAGGDAILSVATKKIKLVATDVIRVFHFQTVPVPLVRAGVVGINYYGMSFVSIERCS